MMSSAFIRAVLKLYPQASIDLIVKQGFEQIPLPHRGKILPFDKRTINAYAFGKRLRSEGYDTIFVLPPSFSSALMAFSAQIPNRIGYKGNFRGLFLNQGKRYQQKHRSQHLVEEYLQLLEENVPLSEIEPGLEINQEWVQKQLGKGFENLPDSFVCIAPGVIYGPAKQWPVLHFKKLITELVEQDEKVVIIGTANDATLAENLVDQTSNIISICGKTNLLQLIAVLAKSKVLVSNDSGTMHVMAALQKPQVAIFGSTSTTWTGPINRNAEVIDLDIECSPCFKRECPYGHYDCLTKISPELVLARVYSALKAGKDADFFRG